jgi:hypothetical protein
VSGYSFPRFNGQQLLFVLRGADMTLTSDQPLTKVFQGTRFAMFRMFIVNRSGAYSTACLGGIYGGAGKTGNIYVAASFSFSALSNAPTKYSVLTSSAFCLSDVCSDANLYLSLSTGNTGALVADLYVYGWPLPD